MGRAPCSTVPGMVYHLPNRRVMRLAIFEKDGDYAAFERVLAAPGWAWGAPTHRGSWPTA